MQAKHSLAANALGSLFHFNRDRRLACSICFFRVVPILNTDRNIERVTEHGMIKLFSSMMTSVLKSYNRNYKAF